MADSKVITFPGGKNVVAADLIPADLKVPGSSISKFQLEVLTERVERITKTIEGQSEVIWQVCDGINEDLPGAIANGVQSTLDWVLDRLEEVKETLATIAESNAEGSGAGPAA